MVNPCPCLIPKTFASPFLLILFQIMASSNNKNWLLLGHEIIFEKIMLMVGFNSPESLDSCRQVCRSWNIMIMNEIWERPTKKWGAIIQRRINKSWGDLLQHPYFPCFPSDEKISQATLLGKTELNFMNRQKNTYF